MLTSLLSSVVEDFHGRDSDPSDKQLWTATDQTSVHDQLRYEHIRGSVEGLAATTKRLKKSFAVLDR